MVKIETLRDIDKTLCVWPVVVYYFNTVDDEEQHEIRANENVERAHKFDDIMNFFKDNAERKIDSFEISYNCDGLVIEIVFTEEA